MDSSENPFRPFRSDLVACRHKSPTDRKGDDRCDGYAQGDWYGKGIRQSIAEAYDKIVGHIDTEITLGDISKYSDNAFRLDLYLTHDQEERNRHQHHIRGAIEEEELHLLLGIPKQQIAIEPSKIVEGPKAIPCAQSE